jgi:hypothetical protein
VWKRKDGFDASNPYIRKNKERKRWARFIVPLHKREEGRNRGRFSVPSLIIRYVINVNVMVEL